MSSVVPACFEWFSIGFREGFLLPGQLEDMDRDWFKTFVTGRNIDKVLIRTVNAQYILYNNSNNKRNNKHNKNDNIYI